MLKSGGCDVALNVKIRDHHSDFAPLDSHDAVLRFNSAPTKGYERDVGNKTTIRIINSQVCTLHTRLFYECMPT